MQFDLTEIIEFILHDGIHRFKKINSQAALPLRVEQEKREKNSRYKKGALFVTRTKEDLVKANGFIVTSVEALEENQDKLSHWTPNIFRYGKYIDGNRKNFTGHEEMNLKQINCFVLDIDLKNKKDQVSKGDIILYGLDHGFMPTLILDTPKGYHVYFVLDVPYFVSNNHDFRGLKIARRIAENISQLFAEEIPGVDFGCNPFGFFRMPTSDNILFYSPDNTYSWKNLMAWSEGYDYDRKRSLFSLVSPKAEYGDRQIDEPWFQKIIQIRDINKGHELGRNNTVLTLSLACFQSGLSEDQCYDMMDEFNTNLGNPLSNREILRTVKSAYSGKYKAAAPVYIKKLLEIWCDDPSIQAKNRVFQFTHIAKKREDRVRSHLKEREHDLITWIEKKVEKGKPFICTTQKQICDETGIAKSTLNKLLNQTKKIFRRVSKGKKGKTVLATSATILKAIINTKEHRSRRLIVLIKLLFPYSEQTVVSLVSGLTPTKKDKGKSILEVVDTG